MEADFLREYRVDLVHELAEMTWRQFQVLIRCLSPNSATVNKLQGEKFIGQSQAESTVEVSGSKAAEDAFSALFEPPPT